ncbi:Hypothetical predicted protein [Octopus vulgaris]|uniref:Uncharacterized protein n=1 Tax=Octopus vulgaris TaxID=6645 RepID=A0AA36FIL5_OCTVU|nr:Hypothetical predicted protein [Octopus vulgaris]
MLKSISALDLVDSSRFSMQGIRYSSVQLALTSRLFSEQESNTIMVDMKTIPTGDVVKSIAVAEDIKSKF